MDENKGTPEQRLETHWKQIEHLQSEVRNLKTALQQVQKEMREMKNGS